MKLSSRMWMWLAVVGLSLASARSVRAETADPLRFVPDQANAIAKIEDPASAYETIYALPLVKELQKLDFTRDLYESTNFRRFQQLVSYFERELDCDKYELLDRLAGGGVVVAARLEKNPKVLAVVQAKDAKLLQKFVDVALTITEKELARQGVKVKPARKQYRNHMVVKFGDKLTVGIADSALLFASSPAVLKAAIDCSLDPQKADVTSLPALQQARKTLGRPLAWGWLHLEDLRKQPKVADGFKTALNQAILTFLVGGIVDVSSRAPFACGGIYHDKNEIRLTVKMDRGMKGMKTAALLLPENKEGSLPILRTPSTIASSSFYLDLGRLWDNRYKLLDKEQLKGLDKLEKNSGRFTAGIKLAKLLHGVGTHHRTLLGQPDLKTYKRTPKDRVPSFALVASLRDPKIGKSLETVIRGAALLGTFAIGMKMETEEIGSHKLTTYRFDESREFKQDKNSIRFNFSPCFARVGDQFMVASTVQLGRELIPAISKQQSKTYSTASCQSKVFGNAAANLARLFEDQLMTQAVLGQALSPKDARDQINKLIKIYGDLGVIDQTFNYSPDTFRYDLRFNLGKK